MGLRRAVRGSIALISQLPPTHPHPSHTHNRDSIITSSADTTRALFQTVAEPSNLLLLIALTLIPDWNSSNCGSQTTLLSKTRSVGSLILHTSYTEDFVQHCVTFVKEFLTVCKSLPPFDNQQLKFVRHGYSKKFQPCVTGVDVSNNYP